MTEKNYNPEQKQARAMKVQKNISQEPIAHKPKEEKAGEKIEDKKTEEKKEEQKKPIQKKEIAKKSEAIVNGKSIPISTLDSMYICKFIKYKTIPKAIEDLEQVLSFKKAIPMKREIPHRKGKIMSGRYPLEACKHFIKLLKTLQANANVNGMDEPIIVEAIANMAYRPFGRFGAVRRKRSHIKIKVVEKKSIKKKKK